MNCSKNNFHLLYFKKAPMTMIFEVRKFLGPKKNFRVKKFLRVKFFLVGYFIGLKLIWG